MGDSAATRESPGNYRRPQSGGTATTHEHEKGTREASKHMSWNMHVRSYFQQGQTKASTDPCFGVGSHPLGLGREGRRPERKEMQLSRAKRLTPQGVSTNRGPLFCPEPSGTIAEIGLFLFGGSACKSLGLAGGVAGQQPDGNQLPAPQYGWG
ncbi:hypothetical protein VTI74DRAFT_1761 [Chaetomium olivicolor]